MRPASKCWPIYEPTSPTGAPHGRPRDYDRVDRSACAAIGRAARRPCVLALDDGEARSAPMPNWLLKLAIETGVPAETLTRRKTGLPSPRRAPLGPSSFVRTLLPTEWLKGLLATRGNGAFELKGSVFASGARALAQTACIDRPVGRPTIPIKELLSVPALHPRVCQRFRPDLRTWPVKTCFGSPADRQST